MAMSMPTVTATQLDDVVFPVYAEAPSKELVVPPAPAGKLSTGLERVITAQPVAQSENQLVCSQLITGATLEKAKTEAAQLYPQMVGSATKPANTALTMAYGSQALEGVNQLIDLILDGTDDVRIPELMALMKDLNRDMRGLQKKYDVSDPKVRAKYENWKGGILGLFGKGKTLVEMLMEDIKSIESQLDSTKERLEGKGDVVTRNIVYYDQLYTQNEAEIYKVIYAIAVMEMIRDHAIRDAAEIETGNANLGDRSGEDKARLVEFAGLMDQKITAYKGRLFIAWATSPNVRNMRGLNTGVLEKIGDTIYTTIPTMKATLAQWRLLAQTVEASKLADMVNDAMNDWLVAFSAASTTGVQMIAQSNNTPMLTPATVAAMAKSVADQADAIVTAMEQGFERRRELDAAIVAGKRAINAADDKLTTSFVQAYVDNAVNPGDVVRALPAS